MTLKAESLETRIRERAAEKLKAEISEASKSFRAINSIGYGIDVHVGDQLSICTWKLIEMIENRIYQELLPRCQEDAIDEFVKRVDVLQSELDALKLSDE